MTGHSYGLGDRGETAERRLQLRAEAFRSLAAATGRDVRELSAAADGGTLGTIIRGMQRTRKIAGLRVPELGDSPGARALHLELRRDIN